MFGVELIKLHCINVYVILQGTRSEMDELFLMTQETFQAIGGLVDQAEIGCADIKCITLAQDHGQWRPCHYNCKILVSAIRIVKCICFFINPQYYRL